MPVLLFVVNFLPFIIIGIIIDIIIICVTVCLVTLGAGQSVPVCQIVMLVSLSWSPLTPSHFPLVVSPNSSLFFSDLSQTEAVIRGLKF